MKSKAGFIFVAHLLWNIFITWNGSKWWFSKAGHYFRNPRSGILRWDPPDSESEWFALEDAFDPLPGDMMEEEDGKDVEYLCDFCHKFLEWPCRFAPHPHSVIGCDDLRDGAGDSFVAKMIETAVLNL